MSQSQVPVIAIDGPTASGKGTVAERVAERLGFHYLDSGSLYRLTALAAARHGIELSDSTSVARVAASLKVAFRDGKTLLEGVDVGDEIRTETASQNASRVAAMPAVRDALLQLQRDFRIGPGLVADGRDMGSVVFPDATLKIYLTASAEARAERRTKQLKQKGMSAIMPDVVKELRARDERDMSRPIAPLKHYPDAYLIDTTGISAEEAVTKILSLAQKSVGT
ncbi:MAG: (d)CMP kinase [Betaproteobacteria bacterium]